MSICEDINKVDEYSQRCAKEYKWQTWGKILVNKEHKTMYYHIKLD